MKQIMAIARKELSSYFRSPVALIFIGIYLLAAVFTFFFGDSSIFLRNVADARALFSWQPLLLAFLAAAISMRAWSDEQRMGTLEVLLTLSVPTWRLVLGKFLAALALVAIALALTVSMPITVSMLGDLDWGPVVGAYLGTILMASTYLAVGFAISASTSNAVVALMLAALANFLLWAVGNSWVVGLFGHATGDVLRSVGTASRLQSVARGVLDLRDLTYYLSLTFAFLLLNVLLLEAKRWSEGASTRAKRAALALTAGLVAVNLLVFNVNIAPVRAARVDMTARGEYSVSEVTEKLLGGLDAPLLIRGYFSEKTHPLLAPLVPRIRDMIAEYDAIGGDRVRGEIIDPRKHPALEKEANEDFGIKSFPFQFADRRQATVANSYFHVLIKYGDKHEVLTFEDLIEVKIGAGFSKPDVKLRNLEYDLTRTIKKVVFGFQPLDELFARVADNVRIKTIVTPKTIPENFKKVPERLRKVAQELAKRSGGKVVYEQVNPSGADKEQLRKELFEKHGFRPLAASLFSQDTFYLYGLIQVGDRFERLMPAPDMSETDIKNEIEAALKRLVPGFLKTVAILSAEPKRPPQNPMMRFRQPPPQDKHRMLRAKLSENYQVRSVQLKDGRVPGDVDVLFVIAPDALDDKQRFAVDQYLMRGGAVIVAQGAFAMDASMRGISLKRKETKLDELLSAWGVSFEPKLVLDPQNESFPIPVERDVMGMRVREIQLLPYPFWVDIRSDGMAEGDVTVSSLPSVTLQWVSPLKVEKKEGVKTTVLLRSTNNAWRTSSTEAQPDFKKHPKLGFGPDKGDKLGPASLAVTATGRFSSAFTGKPSPLFGGDDAAKGNDDKAQEKRSGRTIERSVEGARLVVVGSAEFLNDEVLGLARQTNAERYLNNLRFAQNLVDWAVADTDLLSIRARGTYARTLRPIEESQQIRWEVGNYAFVILTLGGLIALITIRRRSVRPLVLSSREEDE